MAMSDGNDFAAMRVASARVSSTRVSGGHCRTASPVATACSAEIQSEVNSESDGLLATHAARQQVAARRFRRHAHRA